MTNRLHRVIATGAFAAMAGTVIAAADFWETTPFESWSKPQVEKMMGDSPWAHVVAAALPPRLSESGLGPIGRGGEGEAGGFGPGAFRVKVTISWRSALPVKQALVRGQAFAGGSPSAESQEFLTRQEPFYVIGLTGVPPQFSSTPLQSVKSESFLKRDGRPPIPADDVTFQRNGTLVLVAFPRDHELTAEDRDVEFVTKIGEFGLKVKFKLKDMMFHGQLAL